MQARFRIKTTISQPVRLEAFKKILTLPCPAIEGKRDRILDTAYR